MNNKPVPRGEVRVAAAFLIAFASEAVTHGASFLLNVDISNPSAVTITATGENAAADDSSTTTFDGVTLLAFFTSVESLDPPVLLSSSTLQPTGAAVSYTSWLVDDYSGTGVDLNLFEDESGDNQIFTTSKPAFTGTATLDLSGYSLPPSGTTGAILAGYSGGTQGTIIGQYQVVPEPYALPLAASLSLMAFAWMRRRLGR